MSKVTGVTFDEVLNNIFSDPKVKEAFLANIDEESEAEIAPVLGSAYDAEGNEILVYGKPHKLQ